MASAFVFNFVAAALYSSSDYVKTTLAEETTSLTGADALLLVSTLNAIWFVNLLLLVSNSGEYRQTFYSLKTGKEFTIECTFHEPPART